MSARRTAHGSLIFALTVGVLVACGDPGPEDLPLGTPPPPPHRPGDGLLENPELKKASWQDLQLIQKKLEEK